MRMDFEKIFPDNRETGQGPLEQSQLVMLRLLKIFHFLCEEKGVKYFLIGGSSIGAVRHQGFIPWDDDIDVGMTRDNYDKFIKQCVPLLPPDIFFQNEDTDKHFPKNSFVDAKLRDRYSSYKHKNNLNYKYHDGIQLDIFVYEKAYFPNKFLIILQNIILNKISNSNSSKARKLNWIKRYSPFKMIYGNNWQHTLGMITKKIGPTYLKENEINDLIKVKFEDTKVWIPKKFDDVLRRQFGNYMELPPPESRISHHEVSVLPFTPCDHKESLSWNKRN